MRQRQKLREIIRQEIADASVDTTKQKRPPTKSISTPSMNKGGFSGMSMKKPEMMKGGMYKGKSHKYAAGGLVKELKM